jgi:5-methylcytosine-specific restriction endonuclease McrA
MPDRIPTFRPPWVNRRKRDVVKRDQTAAGYGRRAWKLARQAALVRDSWQCQACGRVVEGREAHVDHKVPKSAGGTDYLDNLQVLCIGCHSSKTVRVDMGGAFGAAKTPNFQRIEQQSRLGSREARPHNAARGEGCS